MNIENDNKKEKFTSIEALGFVKELWVSFNSVNMYGAEHPTSLKELEKLYEHLKSVLAIIPRLTLHTEAGNLLCEEWRVDRDIDLKRFVERMHNAGIYTITFFDTIRLEEMVEFMKIMIDTRKFKELENITRYMEETKIKGFMFNYYKFKKMPTDASLGLVQEDGMPQPDILPEAGSGTGSSTLADQLVEEYLVDESQPPPSFSEKLRFIRTRFESGGGPSVEKLADSIARLKTLPDKDFIYGAGVEPSPEEWNATLSELDLITTAIISRAVLGGLQADDLPIKGMVDFFKKLDPNLEFTMKELPHVKKYLFANGITLLQYMQFIRTLSAELTLKELQSLLQKSAGNIGVSNLEIVAEIKERKDEMIPLASLSITLDSLLKDSQEPLLNLLYQYAEMELRSRVLTDLAGKTIEKNEEIDRLLEKSKQQYLRHLAEEGLSLRLIQKLNLLIEERLPALGRLIWAQLLIESTGSRDGLPDERELRSLAEKINSITDGISLFNPMLYILEEKGLSKQLLNIFIQLVTPAARGESTEALSDAEKEKNRKNDRDEGGKSFRLPQGVPNLRETQRFLEMEISRTLRYKTLFSCLSLSVASVSVGKQLRDPTLPELAAIFLEITRLLRDSLRNLDFIGSLGSLDDNHLFVVMTMTDAEGSLIAALRLGEGIKEFPVEVEDTLLSAAVIISVITFNPEETPDISSFLRRVRSRHREEMKSVA
jgi:hypothetical protein